MHNTKNISKKWRSTGGVHSNQIIDIFANIHYFVMITKQNSWRVYMSIPLQWHLRTSRYEYIYFLSPVLSPQFNEGKLFATSPFCVRLILSLVPYYITWRVLFASHLFEDEIGAKQNCKDCKDWKRCEKGSGSTISTLKSEVVCGFVFFRRYGWRRWQESQDGRWWDVTFYTTHLLCCNQEIL